MINPIPKTKRTRLSGTKMKQLQDLIWWRDNGQCQICGQWVDPGIKFHHIKFKSQGGGDTPDNGAILCLECHRKAHGPKAAEIRAYLLQYIDSVS